MKFDSCQMIAECIITVSIDEACFAHKLLAVCIVKYNITFFETSLLYINLIWIDADN